MSKKHIMIVDDDPGVRSLLAGFLQENGYRTSQAASGNEALEEMKREIPHLLISDLLLPGKHGLDLIQIVKTRYFIPIVVLSGIYDHDEVEKAIKENFVEAFFEKPVNFQKLLAKITQLLDE